MLQLLGGGWEKKNRVAQGDWELPRRALVLLSPRGHVETQQAQAVHLKLHQNYVK